MSSRDLAKFTNIRRYATLVCVIQEARATLTDEVIELHERIMGGLFSQAKRKQAERLQLTGKLIQSKLKQYVTVGQALLHARKSGEDPGRDRRCDSLAGVRQQPGRNTVSVP